MMRDARAGLLILLGLTLAASVTAAPKGKSTASARARRPTARTAEQSKKVVSTVMTLIVDHIWERGDYYWHKGRYTDRIATDRLVILMDPKFTEAYSTAGWLLENTGKETEALQLYRRATQVAPQEWKTWHELAWYYYQRKDYPEAIRIYEQAVTKQGVPVFVWKNLAHAYERNGQLRKSLETWNKVRYIDAADSAIEGNVARIEKKLQEQEGGSGRS